MKIIEKETKDNQVELEITFESDDEEIYYNLLKKAKESGITVDELVENILKEYIKEKKYHESKNRFCK